MLIDYQEQFSDAQAITGSARSTNILDFSDEEDVGGGEPVYLLCTVNTTFVGGTSLKVSLQTDDDEAFGSATTVLATDAILTATLVKGYQFKLGPLPAGLSEDYMSLYYTAVGTFSAGKIDAALVADKQTNTGEI